MSQTPSSTEPAKDTTSGSVEKQSPAEALKATGNTLFVEGKFAEAEAVYTEAIALDSTVHLLYGNRSAAICSLGRYEEALSDAVQALKLAPEWIKGYHRQATALMKLERYRDAVAAYEAALGVEAGNKFIRTQMEKAKRAVTKMDTERPVTSAAHWMSIFANIEDNTRLRLAALATWWNLCNPMERHAVFSRFLVVVAGSVPATVTGDDFEPKQMMALPMDNYDDVTVPAVWVEFFAGLASSEKKDVFEASYLSTTEKEKTLIIHDLKHFFIPAEEVAEAQRRAARSAGGKRRSTPVAAITDK